MQGLVFFVGNLFAAVFFFSSCKKKILSQLISQKIETHKLCCLFYISFLLSWLLRSFEFCHFSQLVLNTNGEKTCYCYILVCFLDLFTTYRFVINISYLLKIFYKTNKLVYNLGIFHSSKIRSNSSQMSTFNF